MDRDMLINKTTGKEYKLQPLGDAGKCIQIRTQNDARACLCVFVCQRLCVLKRKRVGCMPGEI